MLDTQLQDTATLAIFTVHPVTAVVWLIIGIVGVAMSVDPRSAQVFLLGAGVLLGVWGILCLVLGDAASRRLRPRPLADRPAARLRRHQPGRGAGPADRAPAPGARVVAGDFTPDPALAGRSVLTLRHHPPAAVTAVLDLADRLKAAAPRAVAAPAGGPGDRADLREALDPHARLVRQRHRPPRRDRAGAVVRRPAARARGDDRGHGQGHGALGRGHRAAHGPARDPGGARPPRRRPGDQRAHLRAPPVPGAGRRADHPRALRRPRGAAGRLPRRRQQLLRLADDRRGADGHAGHRGLPGGLPARTPRSWPGPTRRRASAAGGRA